MIDAIEYVKGAEAVGFTRDQAEFQVKRLNNELDKLVTKDYLKETLSTEFKIFEMKLQGFMIKSLITVVAVLGGLQTILHFT